MFWKHSPKHKFDWPMAGICAFRPAILAVMVDSVPYFDVF